ncbi:peptidylprolyl isomerase [Paratractidigestivibacter sp.]|uniref:peptidylprolyl isomerase n=1 Tax=Paratractidigestivibacter sp. TaxID=2847316 RepID=UPI002ABD1720|nr:peptidylprolyl isomerase [Paratractidigestivibacter sp.]
MTCKDMTRREFLAGAAGAAALVLGGCGSSASGDSAASDSAASGSSASTGAVSEVSSDDPYATGTHHATIEVENYGAIEVALNANVAPITVANFCKLAGESFYDGLTFHRIIKDFMIQGGDPKGDGTGGSDQTIKGEFSQNGVTNPISHVRGTISMARSNAYDSASSQFFIMHKTTTSLDGQYAAFGNVTSGMEVVDAIAENTPVQDSNGTVAAADQPKITKIRVVD